MRTNRCDGTPGGPGAGPAQGPAAPRRDRRRLRAPRCARVLALTLLTLASPGHGTAAAFDGRPQGLTLGLQAGSAHIVRSGTGSASGVAVQLQLGWGLSESFRMCGTAQADVLWLASSISNPNSTLEFEGGSTTAELTYYPRGAKGRWYAVAGVGAGAVHDRTWGLAFHTGVGLDFWRGAQLQLTLARYGGSDDHNASERILLGWCWR